MIQNKRNKKSISLFVITLVFLILQIVQFFPTIATSQKITEVNAWQETIYGGLGTEELPHLISSVEALFWVSTTTNLGNFTGDEYFKLTDNINLDGFDWVPIGNDANAFSGHFDGGGFSIYNIDLKDSASIYKYSGLFGKVNNATIENLKISQVDFELDLTSFEEPFYIGGLAGYMSSSTIDNVAVSGIIQLSNATSEIYLGGVMGYLENSNISQIKNNILVSTTSVATLTAGGLFGKTYRSTIQKSFNEAGVIVTSENAIMAGGLVGEANETNFSKVYNEGAVTATSDVVHVGGLVGLLSSDVGTTNYTTKYAYNTGTVTIKGTNELETNLYMGGLFGQIEARNIVSYTYTVAQTLIDSVGTGSAQDTLYKGTLIGVVDLDAQLISSYYNRDKSNIGTDGVGVNNGTVSSVNDLSSSNMKYTNNYDNGEDWNFTTIWAISGNANGRYPILRYVGNYSIQVQVFGSGKVSTTGINFYPLGNNQIYTITANDGAQIKQIVYDTQTIDDYQGRTTLNFTIENDGMPTAKAVNFVAVFEPLPFTKTQMFYYIVVVGSLIIIMIVGTAIINYRYAIKMDKLMEEKKKTINIDLDKVIINNEELNEVKEKPKKKQ